MTWGVQNTEEEAWEQLDYFVEEKGLSFIDTAELYPVPPSAEKVGTTEEIIGRWMQARGNRAKVFLATKVAGGGGDTRNFVAANRTVPPSTNAPNSRLEREQILAALEGSLRRLQTDYIDLYQLHWPDRAGPGLFGKNQFNPDRAAAYAPVEFDEQVEAVGELIKAGKVRHWGVSNETAYGVTKFAEVAARLGVPPPVTIQNDFSLLDRRFEGMLAEACYYNKVGLLVYGGLAGGTLSDKYHNGEVGANSRHVKFPGFQPRYHSARSKEAAKRYYDLAKSKGLTLQQLALAWCGSRSYVTSIIVGATSLAQLKENVEACLMKLDKETLAAVDEIHMLQRNPNVSD